MKRNKIRENISVILILVSFGLFIIGIILPQHGVMWMAYAGPISAAVIFFLAIIVFPLNKNTKEIVVDDNKDQKKK